MKEKKNLTNQKPIHGVLFDAILPFDNNQQVDEAGIKNQLEKKQLIEPIIFDKPLAFQKNLEGRKIIKPIIYSDPNPLPTKNTQDNVQPSPYKQTDKLQSQSDKISQLNQKQSESQQEYNKNTVPKPIENRPTQAWKRIPKAHIAKPLTKPPKDTPEAIKEKVLKKISIFVHDDIVYVYNGTYYEPVTDKQLQIIVYSICNTEIKENGHINFLNESCKFIKLEPSIQYIDSLHNSNILTFQNGNLSLIDRKFYNHNPQVITCHAIQCNYLSNQQNLNTPHFDALLESISGGNTEIIQQIWQMFGYCLVPDTKAKKVFLLQGVKHSGKSLLCRLLASFFPQSAISALNAHDFAGKFALSELENKALCISADMSVEPLNARTVSNIKQLSGDDLISAAKKYSNNHEFNFYGKLVLVSNHKLLTKKHDEAFTDRIVAIPFPYSIPPEKQDRELFNKLLQEKDAIATKAIQYYFQLRQNHYFFAGDYELNSGDFLNDECENSNEAKIDYFIKNYFEPDRNSELFISDIYELFLQLFDSAIKLNSFSQIFFNKAKALFNCKKSRKRKNTNSNPISLITGIALKEEYIQLLGE